MSRCAVVCSFILALAAVANAQTAGQTRVAPKVAAQPGTARMDCEARIRQLEKSSAEGQERLDEKNEVIDVCDRQYKRDKTVGSLVKECAKFEEQPVIK